MLSIIVAYDQNQVIGINNEMPWHFKEDLQYFKEKTLGKTVVMGSNTYLSIQKQLKGPLPGRHSIVLTRSKDKFVDVETALSVDEILTRYRQSQEEVFIIGGASIYQQFIDSVDRLYITHIDKSYEGDTFFPRFNMEDFTQIEKNESGVLTFCIYERKVTP